MLTEIIQLRRGHLCLSCLVVSFLLSLPCGTTSCGQGVGTPKANVGDQGTDKISEKTSHSLTLKADGTTTDRSSPVMVANLSGVKAVSAGASHSLALKDGTVWAWGNNANGQLGDGTTTQRTSPVKVRGLTGITIIAIFAGNSHSLALDSNETVWAWGNNANGQLGDGTTIEHSSPVQVGGLREVLKIAGGSNYSVAFG
jgi:alpha-tubulin suppressor-like RCC1 family protein